MFLQDDRGVLEASVDQVWDYLSALEDHRAAHHHRGNRLDRLADGRFVASWEQEVPWGGEETFTMRGTPLPPLGIAYEILAGPFAGSVLMNYYSPLGDRTRVTLVGEFASPAFPPGQLEERVRSFFDREFAEDQDGLRRWRAQNGRRAASSP